MSSPPSSTASKQTFTTAPLNSFNLPFHLRQRVHSLPSQSTRTPPSTDAQLSRQSVEPTLPISRQRQRSERSAITAINSAFSYTEDSSEGEEEEEDTANIFPSSFYRQPHRTATHRPTSPRDSMSSTPAGRATPTLQSQDSASSRSSSEGDLRRQPTPENPSIQSANRAYSPMAAGFARLSRKETFSTVPPSTQYGSRGRSLDLDARMFSGAA
ncbi:Hypothetical protein R9X50_00793900 [Acrodontium crateriforme]|uniref:Uncharacterized protein n=1 Tax=Acrodontium crateriforme TaxID=150365 RepID=A0AAQ3RD28_9PEZI|nr:Hypothetical protein R9X50_00793900 [Acrodontium crateriforme]